jgi:predicted nucleic acid-binding Zn ribbon protein
MADCSIPDCTSPVKARNLCGAHYQKFRLDGTLDEVAPPVRRPCGICATPVSGRRWGAQYCSKRCNDKARYQRKVAPLGNARETCQQCDAPLALVRKRRDRLFCSEQCSQTWHNREKARLVAEAKRNGPPCPACGAQLGPYRKIFCSDECKFDDRRARIYGLTVADVHALMESQGRACAICRSAEWGLKGPQVDHCHTNGHVRGLLCASCNNGLGRFKDDPERLDRAAAYLRATMRE